MRGEWIEMRGRSLDSRCIRGLSPCGESGLKWLRGGKPVRSHPSLPMRGEWIEIAESLLCATNGGRSLPMRGEWIEMNPL